MYKLKPIYIEGEKCYARLSFDIDDFIGDGIYWLQIYDVNKNLIYDKPFASSRGSIDMQRAKEIIKSEILNLKRIFQ